MQSESARMTTRAEARYRIEAPNSQPRTVKVIALDSASEPVVKRLAQLPWSRASFLTASAQPAPGRERQILHPAHPDVAKDRNAFGFHEQIVGRFRAAELAKTGAPSCRGLVPVSLPGNVMHG